ncbi:MAG TPA: exodeoxyribonuclease VII large subunit [Myxococcota bacterium]|nr:exodeoxyribonuclease VII large subunit [Myxococcota bacterium]
MLEYGDKADLFSPEDKTYTVSELTGDVRALLEDRFGLVRVVGELSGLSRASSGHFYFSLKDERASIQAVMFRSAAARLPDLPEDGDEVECLGRLTMYEPRGRTQLIVERLVPRGAGELGLRFLRLKKKLAAEGLFDPECKRPLPYIPGCIGVVTSPTGAAIRDILNVLGRRFPSVPVLIYPVRVQGDQAAAEIAAGIERLEEGGECDVIIIGRGGGSAEDLWAFNEEIVVRAVAASKVPIVSAVGHEVDIVLSDLAADLRAPTPSAAAELVVPDRDELQDRLTERVATFSNMISLRLAEAHRRLAETAGRVRDPRLVLAAYRLRLDESLRAANSVVDARLDHARRELTNLRLVLAGRDPRPSFKLARQTLDSGRARFERSALGDLLDRRMRIERGRDALRRLDPLSVLARGYSVVTTEDGKVLQEISSVKPGDEIHVRLQRGELDAGVHRVQPHKEPARGAGAAGD